MEATERNTTATDPSIVATTTDKPKSAKQRKREAADRKLATTSQPAKVAPIYAKPDAPKPQEQTGEAKGHNSNKGKQIAMNTVGPKRELAYAVVSLLAILADLTAENRMTPEDPSGAFHEETQSLNAEWLESQPGFVEAKAALAKHGYENLRPRAERIATLKAALQTAAAEGDLKRVQELAKEMKAVQDGRAD